MKLKMAKKTTKLASFYFIVVFLCAMSVVGLSQFRILCELGEAAELLQSSSQLGDGSHEHHQHSSNDQTASKEAHRAHGHAHAHDQGHSHSGDAPHSHSKQSRAHADHQGHSSVGNVAHEKKGSQQDDPCCSATGFTEFNVSKSLAHFSPAFVTALIQYVVAVLDPTDIFAERRSEHFAKLNAPPPISLHIPTTILRI